MVDIFPFFDHLIIEIADKAASKWWQFFSLIDFNLGQVVLEIFNEILIFSYSTAISGYFDCIVIISVDGCRFQPDKGIPVILGTF